jgi:flagellar motor switch protein FliM
MMTQIVERLTGATGEPDRVIETARACADRCLAEIAPELAQLFSVPVRVECSSVELARFASSRPAAGGFGAMFIAAADTSPDALLLTIDAEALAIAVCGMFGADEDFPVVPINRPLSTIELDVAAKLAEAFAVAFNGSGERAFGIRFPLAAPIAGDVIAKQVIRDGPAARVTFELALGESRGRLSVTIPQRVLMENRGVANTHSSSARWRERFSEEVMRSTVSLQATVPLARLTLAQVAALQVGQILELPEHAPTQTRLSAKDQTLFLCEFGKLGQNYTVRIAQPFDAQQDFVEGLLTA